MNGIMFELFLNDNPIVNMLKSFLQVFSWGDGEYGKLGHGNSATQKYPKMIQGPLLGKVSLQEVQSSGGKGCKI